ncbi:dynamin family protein [Goodfellowiella coeruleoviolacea]|nr:dynamin family protein [Goodfellowiella coeruleoviolacea]
MTAPPWLDVLDETVEACATHGRADLAHRLRQKRARLLDPQLRVLVLGEANQGKSQLVNALVNAPVCAVGDDTTTTVPTVVQHADSPFAALVRTAAGAGAVVRPSEAATERVPVPIDEIAAKVSGRGVAGEFVRAEVGVPRQLLASGLTFIDTPSTSALHVTRTVRPLAALTQADAVLLVSDATQELSSTELDLIRQVVAVCPNLILAVTKTDIAPGWRRVVQRNHALLTQARVAARLVAVSAALRLRAARTGDKALNTESGFPELIACLQQHVVAKADQLAQRTAAVTVCTAVEQLVAPLQAELTAQDPGQTSDAIARLHQAQRRAEELRRRSARWQHVLADNMADLAVDIEYDLRDRTRRILRESERVLDRADPAVIWDTFKDWLEDSLAEAAEANFAWLVERCQWVARKVAVNFPAYRDGMLPDGLLAGTEEVLSHLSELERPPIERFTISQKVFTVLRGSYGGVLMFGLVTSLAGMPLINAISLGAGALFGGKSVHDESEARLKRRQAAAKTAAQRYVDDFFLAFSKDCKDIARQVQRRLRDHFTVLAEELQETVTESARSAKRAVQSDVTEREARKREIKRELERLVVLHRKAQLLAAPAKPAVAAAAREITA